MKSIDALYAAVSDVAKPTRIGACPCCIEEKNLCVLLAKPLRELTPDDLSSYASSAFLTAGDVPDYLYFLSRILAISVTNDSNGTSHVIDASRSPTAAPKESPNQPS